MDHTNRVDREPDDLCGRSCPPAQESLKIKQSTKWSWSTMTLVLTS